MIQSEKKFVINLDLTIFVLAVLTQVNSIIDNSKEKFKIIKNKVYEIYNFIVVFLLDSKKKRTKLLHRSVFKGFKNERLQSQQRMKSVNCVGDTHCQPS